MVSGKPEDSEPRKPGPGDAKSATPDGGLGRLTRLTLGGAALGQAYGIANPETAMTAAEAEAVLDACWSAGIRAVDVAPAYGDAERRVGGWIAGTGHDPVVITKIPPLADVSDEDVPTTVAHSLSASRRSLRVHRLDGVLLHRAADWARATVRQSLRRAQDRGEIGRYGLSAYDADEAHALLDVEPASLFQIPFGLFDRRAREAGLLDRVADAGGTVFARSVFLQGLLFRDPATLPDFFKPAARILEDLRALADGDDSRLAAIAVQAALQDPGIRSVIVGVHAPEQAIAAARASMASDDRARVDAAIDIARALPAEIRDPRRWPA